MSLPTPIHHFSYPASVGEQTISKHARSSQRQARVHIHAHYAGRTAVRGSAHRARVDEGLPVHAHIPPLAASALEAFRVGHVQVNAVEAA